LNEIQNNQNDAATELQKTVSSVANKLTATDANLQRNLAE